MTFNESFISSFCFFVIGLILLVFNSNRLTKERKEKELKEEKEKEKKKESMKIKREACREAKKKANKLKKTKEGEK